MPDSREARATSRRTRGVVMDQRVRGVGLILSVVVLLVGLQCPLWAVPNLQLYVEGATWDPVTETWVTTLSEFDIQVIGANVSIADVNVQIYITHTYNSDLDVYLIAPDGTRIELFTDVGGRSDGFAGTVLDDEAETPINEGTACSKGSSLYQLANNSNRLTKVLYRAPFAREWTEMGWEEAVGMIAQRIKTTRDATFETTNASGKTVNRTLGIGSLGSAALDNEECWLYQKFLRTLGLIYIEHQARN